MHVGQQSYYVPRPTPQHPHPVHLNRECEMSRRRLQLVPPGARILTESGVGGKLWLKGYATFISGLRTLQLVDLHVRLGQHHLLR